MVSAIVSLFSTSGTRHDESVEHPETLGDVAKLISVERESREAAMAETRKILDWRIAHIAEEFRMRLAQLERKLDTECRPVAPERRGPQRHPLAEMGRLLTASEGQVAELRCRHALEGVVFAEVQRWGEVWEASFAEVWDKQQSSASAIVETRALLAQVQDRLARTEALLASGLAEHGEAAWEEEEGDHGPVRVPGPRSMPEDGPGFSTTPAPEKAPQTRGQRLGRGWWAAAAPARGCFPRPRGSCGGWAPPLDGARGGAGAPPGQRGAATDMPRALSGPPWATLNGSAYHRRDRRGASGPPPLRRDPFLRRPG